jgi:hypothetical protein
MILQEIAPLKPQPYETELADLRLAEDALFEQALCSPQDEMYSGRCSESYAYTARDIVMGRY